MLKTILTPSTFLLCLAACGGSSREVSEQLSLAAIEADIGGRTQTIVYDPTTDTYLTDLHGGSLALVPDSVSDNGTFRFAQGAGADEEFGLFESSTDETSVILFRPDPAFISGGPVAILSRSDGSEIPTTGTATLTGDYQAIQQGGTGATVFRIVTGQASLDVNFASQTIGGEVTNRVARLPADNSIDTGMTFETLSLNAAIYGDDGVFTTSTSGGELEIGSSPTLDIEGSYRGLIGGTGDQAVAGVDVQYNFGGGGLIEIGAIAAGH